MMCSTVDKILFRSLPKMRERLSDYEEYVKEGERLWNISLQDLYNSPEAQDRWLDKTHVEQLEGAVDWVQQRSDIVKDKMNDRIRFAVGVALLLLNLVLAVVEPHPPSFLYVVQRFMLAISIGLICSFIPGSLVWKAKVPWPVEAGGGLAGFLLTLAFTPSLPP